MKAKKLKQNDNVMVMIMDKHVWAKFYVCVVSFVVVLTFHSLSLADEELQRLASTYRDATSYFLLGQKFSLNGQHSEAFAAYHEAARLGHARSKLKLGTMYFNGEGVGSDYDLAHKWLKEPAAKGYNSAQYMLGMIYLKGGSKVKSDKGKAFSFLKKAADDFHNDALYQAGKLYFFGIGTRQSNSKAKKYLNLAREQNVASAAYLLEQIRQEESKPVAKAQARDLLLNRSLSGDQDSQHQLALNFLNGSDGYKKNVQKSLMWFTRSAENGQIKSQLQLGRMYMEGMHISANPEKARKWLESASSKGSRQAESLLAELDSKQKKEGVPKSKKDYYLSAAKKGDKDAQYKVGLMYLNGQEGFKKNSKQALKWLKSAAKQNHISAQYQTGMAYFKPGASSNNKAYRWLRKAARNGHSDAQYFLGTIYQGKKDYDEAVKWLDSAAKNNHNDALDMLVELYLQGSLKNLERDRLIAWLEKASLNGFRDAQFELGKQYLMDKSVANNKKQAYAWIEKAAKKGNVKAKYRLGMMLKQGLGVRKHYTKSARWLKSAAQDGNVDAQFELAQLYDNGVGLPRSKNKAKKWYTQAAKQGHVHAKIQLGRDSRF